MASKALTVGIDVGGTFTDLLAVDTAAGTVKLAKVPTTVENQAIGFMASLAAAGTEPANLQAIVHGTTTTTNGSLSECCGIASVISLCLLCYLSSTSTNNYRICCSWSHTKC